MANNRIFLVNRITRKFLCIAKNLGGPWYICGRCKELDNFFSDEKNEKSFWKDEHCYEIMYEDSPDFPGDLENF